MHLTFLNFFKERCNKWKEQYFSRILPFYVVKPWILNLAIIGFQYTAGSRVKNKISINVLKNANSEISKKSWFSLGTLVLWIPRSILDLNLLLICGLTYSLFDKFHIVMKRLWIDLQNKSVHFGYQDQMIVIMRIQHKR